MREKKHKEEKKNERNNEILWCCKTRASRKTRPTLDALDTTLFSRVVAKTSKTAHKEKNDTNSDGNTITSIATWFSGFNALKSNHGKNSQ